MNLRAEHLRQVVAGAPVAPIGPVAKRLVRTFMSQSAPGSDPGSSSYHNCSLTQSLGGSGNGP